MIQKINNEKYYYDEFEREARQDIAEIREAIKRDYLRYLAKNYIGVIN